MAVSERLVAPVDAVRAAPPAMTAVPVRMALARAYFLTLALLGLAVFVLGLGNRFTADGVFLIPPQVGWIPPLSARAWSEAFAIHQQDPVFAACGGTESLPLFKTLYWWEWLRQAFLLALGAVALLGLATAATSRRYGFALSRVVALAVLALAFWPARWALAHLIDASRTVASFNVGQYRHAVAVMFASAALAAVLASAAAPPRPERAKSWRIEQREWLWIAAILIDIGFGALFAARDAAASWPSLLGYEGHVLPPLAQLLSYSPWWLNFTFNPLTIQLAHRTLSAALWLAASWELVTAMRGRSGTGRAALRFLLITGQMASGIMTLVLAVPALLSIVHQVGAVFLLAASMAFLRPGGLTARAKVPS
jgi:heme a synthase